SSTSPKGGNPDAAQSHRADVSLRALRRRLLRAAVAQRKTRAGEDVRNRLQLAVLRRHRAGVADVSVPAAMTSTDRGRPARWTRGRLALGSSPRMRDACA